MIIIANTLGFNGGTTFILRLAKELAARGDTLAVIVLVDKRNKGLEADIGRYADIFYLADFLPSWLGWTWRSQLGIFMPFSVNRLNRLFNNYGGHIHVMGTFGLLFAIFCAKRLARNLNISAGVYHQNEFMFQSPGYLVEETQKLFASLPISATVFFNEANQISYGQFFGRDYGSATLVPIGIDMPEERGVDWGSEKSHRVVSIGNLYDFKTYNLHVIKTLPALLEQYPDFRYDIYGEGVWQPELEKLIEEMGLTSHVSFHGQIPYEKFDDVLQGAFLFVGSGTAILEAGALGIPSLVGIESLQEPLTYGFISDIQGFSYSEFTAGVPTFLLEEKLLELCGDKEKWLDVSRACRLKAETFSIEHTVDGLQRLNQNAGGISEKTIRSVKPLRLLLAFVLMGLRYKLGLDKSFSNRRNQGTL